MGTARPETFTMVASLEQKKDFVPLLMLFVTLALG